MSAWTKGLAAGAAIAAVAGCGARHPRTQAPPPLAAATALPAAAHKPSMPLYFVENRGQLDPEVKYYVRGARGSVYFTGRGIVYEFVRKVPRQEGAGEKEPVSWRDMRDRRAGKGNGYERIAFRVGLSGDGRQVEPAGVEPLPGRVNYLLGPERSSWRTDIPTYAALRYRGVREGIDLAVGFEGRDIGYRFDVAPGADPGAIALRYEGVDGLAVKPGGELMVMTPFGTFVEKAPEAYQEISGRRVRVDAKYRVAAGKVVTLAVAGHDPRQPLCIGTGGGAG